MPDIGFDSEALRIKCLEKEIEIDERSLAQRRIRLEIVQMQKRIADCTNSVSKLDIAITMSRADLASLQAAAEEKAKAESVTDV